MKKRKRIAAALIAVGIALTMSACGEKEYGLSDDTFYGDITLGKYREVEVQKGQLTATEEDWEAYTEYFLAQYPIAVPIEGKTVVEDGDKVDIGFVGKVDGVAFEGGTDDSYILTIGSNNFIDGFEEQVIGMTTGQTKDIQVTFPDPYNNDPELAGKDAVFTVTLHAIVEEQQAEQMTDELVAENTDYATIEEYKAFQMGELTADKTENAENQVFIDVIKQIVADSTISDVPEEIIKSFQDNFVSQYQSSADSLGLTLENAVNMFMGISLEDFNNEVREASELQVHRILIAREIIALEKLKLSSEEYKEILEEQAALPDSGFTSAEEMEEAYGKDYLTDSFLMEKALQIIYDTMIVKEYSAE